MTMEQLKAHEKILHNAEHPSGNVSMLKTLDSLNAVRSIVEKSESKKVAERGIGILSDGLNHHEKNVSNVSRVHLDELSKMKGRAFSALAAEAIKNCKTNRKNFGEKFPYHE